MSWDTVKTKIKESTCTGTGLEYLKIQSGKNRVRLAGEPVAYWYIYDAGRSIVIGEADVDRARVAGHMPKQAVACYCFDRANASADGEVKVLDKGWTVYGPITDMYRETDIDPCTDAGYEYLITSSGTGLSTRYTVIPIKQSPYTPAEQAAIKSLDMDALRKRYTPKDGAVNALVGEVERELPVPAETAPAPETPKFLTTQEEIVKDKIATTLSVENDDDDLAGLF